MTAPYSVDLRERALARKEEGETNREIAAALRISPSCVSKWTKRKRETGSLVPAQIGGYKPRTLSGESADWLRSRVGAGRSHCEACRPSWPNEESRRIRGRSGCSFTPRAWASKKTLLAEEQRRPDVARKRERWKVHQGRVAASRLVFIDETWVKTNMAPLRGWGPRGRRLKAYAPHGHWKTLTFIAALRHDRIDAPWVIDGPINGEIFLLYIEKILAPTLSPGDIVVLDNLGSHKGKAARAIVRAKRAHLIFLPPYSPDLNPIEQVFAKLKHLVRKAQPRDVEATWRKVGQLLDLFSPPECANYLLNSGYGSV
jgi:transposase